MIINCRAIVLNSDLDSVDLLQLRQKLLQNRP